MKVNGSMLVNGRFVEGHVRVENGLITEISENMVHYPDATGIVIPYFFNYHTHLGDSFIENVPKLPVDRVVGPGGFKEMALRAAEPERIVSGMEKSMKIMESSHTAGFMDFREGGIEGVELMKKAMEGHKLDARILSRPVKWEDEEIARLLEISDGFGMSSISDHDFESLLMLSEEARRRKKLFSIHLSERVREDVGKVLELRPDFIIHAIEVNDEDLEEISAAKIPVVVCPRSNAFFGKRPRIKDLVEHGIDVRVGTDNAMLAKPDILEEMRYLYISTPKNEREYVERIVPGIFGRKDLKGGMVGIDVGQPALLVKAPWLHPEKGLLKAGEIITLTGSGPYGRDKEDTDSD